MSALGDDSHASTGSVALHGLRFDLRADELFDEAGGHVALRPQCLAVLRCLARRAGRVVAKEDLIREVWPNLIVTDDSLVQCISDLRRVLGDAQHRVLQTEPRRGYRLVPSRASNSEPAANGPCVQEVRLATSADGTGIAYVCCGDGVPVLRVPPMFSHLDYDMDCLTSGPILQALADRHRLVRYDQRGQGLSDCHAGIGTMQERVSDLCAVADAEALSRFVIWASGPNAAVAIRFAALHPQRVERLILAGGYARFPVREDPFWGWPTADSEPYIEALWHDENALVRLGGGPQALSRHFPGATPEQLRSFDRMLRLSCTGSSAVSVMRFCANLDVSTDLGRIRCPTLVMHSQRNLTVPLDAARVLAAGIPDARLVTLDTDNCIPLAHEPAFDEMIRLVDDFIAESVADWRSSPAVASAAVKATPVLRVVGRGRNGRAALARR